jgi:lipoprotein-anchoring transpeptidase ErfK/SrfK
VRALRLPGSIHPLAASLAAALLLPLLLAVGPAGAAAQRAVALEDPPEATAAQADPAVYRAGMAARGMRILVSTGERRLLLMADRDTLLDVPVAVGMGTGFEFEGREYQFETPTGRRRVRGKEQNPVWTPPDWHYKERALQLGLELVRLKEGDRVELEDGSVIVVEDGQVGRINQFGNFRAFDPGLEIIFDGRIFMPPFGTAQRRVPDALGPYKLDMGDGYLIHGTHLFNEESIGLPVSHGCVRMNNSDLDRLYYMVETGTPVYIF